MSPACRLIRRLLVAVAAAAISLDALGGPAATPVVRVGRVPAQVMIGQAVELELTTLVPGWFTGPLDLPDSLAIEGATARLQSASAASVSESRDGLTWAGLRRVYQVVPTREGTIAIPPVMVSVHWSNGQRTAVDTVRSTPVSFAAALPAPLRDLGYVIAVPRLDLAQRVDRPLRDLRVGDAFIRTVTMQATGISAMQLPPLTADAPAGLAVYADAPRLDDRRGERGAPDRASVVHAWTYVLQAPGRFELPGLELHWFDTAAGQARVARVPTLRFDVAGDPLPVPAARAATAAAPSPPAPRGGLVAGALGLLAGLALAPGLLRRVRLRAVETEARAFRRSLVALWRAPDALARWRALEAWHVASGAPARPLCLPGEPRLDALRRAAFAPAPPGGATGQAGEPADAAPGRWQALRLLRRLRRQRQTTAVA